MYNATRNGSDQLVLKLTREGFSRCWRGNSDDGKVYVTRCRAVWSVKGNQVTRRHQHGVEPPDRAEYKAHWTIIIWHGTKVRDSVSRPVLSSWKKYGRQTYEEIQTSRQPLFTATLGRCFRVGGRIFVPVVPLLSWKSRESACPELDKDHIYGSAIVVAKTWAQVHRVRLLALCSVLFLTVLTG